MTQIVIYTAKDGHIELDVSLADETIWLSQQQMADLFGTKRQAITRHLRNIFNSNELDENLVCSILERTAADGKKYKTKFYNLDAIVSIGYRVNSQQATQFRIWATQVLKEHLIRGYTTYDKRLSEVGIRELQQTLELLQKTLVHHDLVNDLGQEAIQLILAYTKTWDLLLAYDEDRLQLPSQGKKTKARLQYEGALSAIEALKVDLSARKEASDLFGREREFGLQSILKNIEQTFAGEPLYKTGEEKAAHLLYFIIKDHPFTDGNKRIGSFMFLLYLKSQNIVIKLNENGLVALALLVAESDPKQKEMIVRLIVNLLIN
ncbi:MAG: virulence protein RhuM/Fic/DOC family protein [Gammaproteobacteria bacterium]|nr:virulence protein RhuM/Fic/DOC family protein [Gammaproteobacteria bacterium]